MSRRQSLDRPGILSPPGPFLTPSPSPSISASPRLQPSPSLSPFPQDALFIASGSQANAIHDYERKTVTPSRRQSIHQFANGSPNAGSIVFQPSPSQSPAAATTVIGVTTGGIITAASTALTNANANELNATLVGSNNIQLNKKRNKRASQQQESHLPHQIFNTIPVAPSSITVSGCGYGKPNTTTVNPTTSFAATNMASSPKNQAKKIVHHITAGTAAEALINQQLQQYQSCSPLIADSPIASPSSTMTSAAIKPPSQSLHMVQQQFTVNANTPSAQSQTFDSQQQPTQVYQFIQGPQGHIIATHLQQQQNQLSVHPQQPTIRLSNSTSFPTTTITTNAAGTKSTKQILPKPQHQDSQQQQLQLTHNQNQSKIKNVNNSNITSAGTVTITTSNIPQIPQISQSSQTHQALLSVSNSSPCTSTSQQQQILLPTGAATNLQAAQTQPLLLNQMPVLVQQNTSQGVQLIIRPPTPQLTATPSLVIQNTRGQPQIHQQHPQGQQLLRIVGTNGATMQLAAATPTFIVSSQANLIQQTAAANQLQTTIKSSTQTAPAIAQLTGLQAAIAAQTSRSQPFTTTTTINPQLVGPNMAAQLQNLQLAAAATANGNGITQIQMPNGLSATGALISQLPAQLQQTLSGATININQLNSSQLQQIAAALQNSQSSAKVNASPEIFTQSTPSQEVVSTTPEVLRQSTPVIQQPTMMPTNNSLTTIQMQQQAQVQHFHTQLQKTQFKEQQLNKQNQITNAGELKKKSRQRKKKSLIVSASTITSNKSETQTVASATATNVLQNSATILSPTSFPSISSKITSASSQHIHRASNGKLDLGNVMKLCGITEDDDDDEDYTVNALPNTTHVSSDDTVSSTVAKLSSESSALSAPPTSSKDIMISIPNQNCGNGLPFTLSIPTPSSTTLTRTSTDAVDSSNFLIEIEQNINAQTSTSTATNPPYTISIPRLPTAEEIQKQAQQHLAQQAAVAAAAKPTAGFSTAPTISFNLPVLQQNELFTNHKVIGNNSTVQPTLSTITSTTPTLSSATSPSIDYVASTNSIATTTLSTATTATVKPRRKPAMKRNVKKQEPVETTPSIRTNSITTSSLSGSISTASISVPISSTATTAIMVPHTISNTPITIPTSVPSQIGNIQISQVQNHQTLPTAVSNSVENKIQIMPIIDNTRMQNGLVSGVTAPQLQLQQHPPPQLVFHPTNSNLPHTNMEGRSTIELSTDCRQVQLVAIPQASTGTQASSSINHGSNLSNSATVLPSLLSNMPGNMSISVGSPASTTAIIPQLSGSLTLAVSEHCERLILRHDPNQPQDQQSHLILQALLKGALPNVTIINEPSKVDNSNLQSQQHQHHISQVPIINKNFVVPSLTKNDKGSNNKNAVKMSTPAANSSSLLNKITFTAPIIGGISSPQIKQSIQSNTTDLTKINLQPQLPQASMQPANNNNLVKDQPTVATSQALTQQQRYVALPKIDSSTHQLFCLNTINNQITTINSGQTTASISSTERLLIAPAGINAQQLAQCLQQGQIHFNDVNPLQMNAINAPNTSVQVRTQPTQQQIVHPVQPLSITNATTSAVIATLATTTNTSTISTTAVAKQVANVAPIIDQSKAKIEPTKNTSAVKKKPIRKPKAATTPTDVVNLKNASVVKPMPKLDPLSQKHNNNPVQIVQPNVASGKQVITITTSANSQTSTIVTTTSNSIHPFNVTHSGTKLVGITAPMQQQLTNLQQSSQLINTNNIVINNQIRQNLNNSALDNLSTTGSSGINFPNIALTSTPIVNVSTSCQTHTPLAHIAKTSAINTECQTQTQQQQHTVSRVQTIQLSPQQQRAFKQVQMQIHYLTIKLQHKSLLSPLTLPPDFDHTVISTFNKPMTDAEINIALQRLFLEQQRILATGKEIPTPESLLPSSNNGSGFTITTQPQTTAELNKSNIPANVVQPNNHSASEAKGNMFQQQSTQQHFVAQRIHIYPIQHHQNVQQNKQKQQLQQKSNQLQAQHCLQQITQIANNATNSQKQKQQDKAKDIAKSKYVLAKQQQQIQNSELSQPKSSILTLNVSSSSFQEIAATQPLHELSINQQSNGNNTTGPPPLIFANSNNLLSNGNSNPLTNSPSNCNLVSTLQNQQHGHKSNQIPLSINQAICTNDKTSKMAEKLTPLISILPTYISEGSKLVATVSAAFNKSDDISSPKPKIARLSLFVRQLEVDQESCFKPDCVKPFRTKEEAVKRLIRYHCMHENDESIPSDEELEFEQTALKFQKRFCQLTGKFRQILLEESTLSHSTSESLQLQQILIDDLKLEIDDLRKAEKKLQQEWENNQLLIEADKCELEALNVKETNDKQEQNQHPNIIFTEEKDEIKLDLLKDFPITSLDDKFDLVKNSADLNKSYNKYQVNESTDIKSAEKCSWKNLNDNNIDNSINSISLGRNETFCQKHLNGNMKNNIGDGEQSESDVKEFENFDIESELPPSFIMKKMENKNIPFAKQYNMQSNGLSPTKNSEACAKNCENGKIQQQSSKLNVVPLLKPQNQQQLNLDDDWYCLQKELNLISSTSTANHNTVMQQFQHPNSNVQNLVQLQNKPLNAFGNNISSNVNSLDDILSDSHDSTNINNLSCSEQRQQPVHQKAQNRHSDMNEFFNTESDVQKSVETRLEAMFGESPVPLDVKNSNDTQDIESNLEDIFGDSKLSCNNSKMKNNIWDTNIIGNNLLRNTTNINFDGDKQQEFRSRQTDLPPNGVENQRWIQSVPNFGDFMSATNTTSESQIETNGKTRKRLWTTQLMGTNSELEDDTSNKRLCVETLNSSSQLSHPQINLQSSIIDTEILSLNGGIGVDASINNSNNNGPSSFSQLLMNHQQQHQHDNFGIHQTYENLVNVQNPDEANLSHSHFENNLENHIQGQPQIQSMHNTHHIPNVNVVAEFDDDISRHVQNAIDSILNLQNNETDSLTFSLGSLLGESILDDQRQQLTTNLPSCQQENKQRQLVDDLGDCLISGGTNATVVETNIGILNESHQQHNHRLIHNNNCHIQNDIHNINQRQTLHETTHQQHLIEDNIHHQHSRATPHQHLCDFPCVTGGLDEGVKSILTS